MRQERDIERADPQTLEIALIQRFESSIQNIHKAASATAQAGLLSEDPKLPELTTSDNRFHYYDSSCPEHSLSEVFTATSNEGNESFRANSTNFSKLPDGDEEITSMVGSEIKIENGFLASFTNPALFKRGLVRLREVEEELTGNAHSKEKAQAETELREAGKLIDELSSLHEGDGLWFESPDGQKAWAVVMQDSLAVGIKNGKTQFELSYVADGNARVFKSIQYYWGSEQPEIVDFAVLRKDDEGYTVQNPNYLKRSLFALKNVASMFKEKRELRAAREKLVQVLAAQGNPEKEQIPPGKQIRFDIKAKEAPAVEVLIAQTKPF